MSRATHLTAILLLVTSSVLPQVSIDPSPSEETLVWQPPKLQLPDTVPRPTIPKEMITTLRVATLRVVLDKTRMVDAEKSFGGSLGRSGDAGDSLTWLCFQGAYRDMRWGLWLESSELGGDRIDGFALQMFDPHTKIDPRCLTLGNRDGEVALPIGLRLGASETQVGKLLGQPSARYRNILAFDHEHNEKIHGQPFTASNTVYITVRDDIVWGIQVWKHTVS